MFSFISVIASSSNCCVLSEHFDAGTPARMARLTSWVEDASKLRPMLSNSLSTAPFGQAFMAYLTVRP